MAGSHITKEVRESYLDDVQILRDRGLSVPQIAEILSQGERQVHKRQVDRWAAMLKEQHRWRNSIKDMGDVRLSGFTKTAHENRNERFRTGR